MAALLTTQTTDATGTGAAMSGPCTVYVRGTLGGATVQIQVADADSSVNYVTPDKSVIASSEFKSRGAISLSAYGAYYVRAVLGNATSDTSVSVVALQ